jgi:hypothetical protein
MRYGELTFTAQAGFNFIRQTSRAMVAPMLSNVVSAISSHSGHGRIVS